MRHAMPIVDAAAVIFGFKSVILMSSLADDKALSDVETVMLKP